MADLGRKWSKIQNSISQRIFNHSPPDFYPHWSLAVAIQSRCWNYPTMPRFGQTVAPALAWWQILGQKLGRRWQKYSGRFRVWPEEVGQGQRKVGQQDGVLWGSIPTKFHQNPIINDKVIWIWIFLFLGQKWVCDFRSQYHKSRSRSLKVGQCTYVH